MLRAAAAAARTPAAIAKATRQKLAAGTRSAWLPQLDGPAATGDPSQFGGLPWLRATEVWPACGGCEAPLTFFVQVDLSRTPKAARDPFGLGLLQLFHCTTCNPYRPFSSGDLVRIVDPADAVTPAKEPEGARVLPVRPITGWGLAVKDYPYREADESALLPEEREIVFTLNRQGDKLGGLAGLDTRSRLPALPPWRPSNDTADPADRLQPWRRTPWGDNGVSFLVQCPQHREEVTFLWQCA
ncbi:DUF1963 domain-containing protein [Nonomuraea sp. NPDC049158]|uniref:DUF1963 domain-containing protein n=1 Tax=Nonomuraea sp. NPDC049158 TaxID=3155649 RepID=UPI0033E8E01A